MPAVGPAAGGRPGEGAETSGAGFVEALAHPLRSRIFLILAHEPASAAEIARELDTPVRTVRHHLAFLRKRGYVSVRRSRRRRNVNEYSFESASFGYIDDRLYASLRPAERRALTNHYLRVIWLGVDRFAAAGTTYDTHFPFTVRVRLAVDEAAWAELEEILGAALEEVLRVKREAGGRLAGREAEGSEAEVDLLAFEAPPGRAATRTDAQES
jgi:DNA-binding transcriptional ArsR family regulator